MVEAMISDLHAHRYAERRAQREKYKDYLSSIPSDGTGSEEYIVIPGVAVPLEIEVYHNATLAKDGRAPVQVSLHGLAHPDIADNDFMNYFGPESKDGRLRPVADLVEQIFGTWYDSRQIPETTLARTPKKGWIRSPLGRGWRKEAGHIFHDYFKREPVRDRSIDSVEGWVARKSYQSPKPTDQAIAALDPSDLIANLQSAVPQIQELVINALKTELPANATEHYRRGMSNALASLNGQPGIDMRLTEAEVNDKIGRPLPEGVIKIFE